MNAKEALKRIVKRANAYGWATENTDDEIMVMNALNRLEELEEVLKIIKEKGVAVGFIQLLLTENCGGLKEYNDYIGDNKLYLTETEFNLLKEYLK